MPESDELRKWVGYRLPRLENPCYSVEDDGVDTVPAIKSIIKRNAAGLLANLDESIASLSHRHLIR